MSGWSPSSGPTSKFTPGQAVVPTSTVELSISCENLADLDCLVFINAKLFPHIPNVDTD